MPNKKLRATAAILISGVVVIIIAGAAITWSGTHRLIQTNGEMPVRSTAITNSIIVDRPARDQTIQLPYEVVGTVKGSWFFEGSFSIQILNAKGDEVGNMLAHSSQNWMTDSMIPFSATLPSVDYHGDASIVFHKSNPSGDRVRDESMTLNIVIR